VTPGRKYRPEKIEGQQRAQEKEHIFTTGLNRSARKLPLLTGVLQARQERPRHCVATRSSVAAIFPHGRFGTASTS
jgi:hypothetical protein